MLKRALIIIGVVVVVLVGVTYGLYVSNVVPAVPAVSAEEAAKAGKPYVVKLHAQWCPVCMLTKDVWSRIVSTYAGRVHLVVLDFTNEAKREESRATAARLGLQAFFDEYSGATGTIVALDGRTRTVTASINGSRDFSEYRAAIDAALNASIAPVRWRTIAEGTKRMLMRKMAVDSLTLLRALMTVLFVCAMAGLLLTALFGFEEPNNILLLLSSGLLLTAIAAVFIHLAVNRQLTRSQKHIWLRHLTGRRALFAWTEYLTCNDLPAAARQFSEGMSARDEIEWSIRNAEEKRPRLWRRLKSTFSSDW
jgi:hypothetical protein